MANRLRDVRGVLMDVNQTLWIGEKTHKLGVVGGGGKGSPPLGWGMEFPWRIYPNGLVVLTRACQMHLIGLKESIILRLPG